MKKYINPIYRKNDDFDGYADIEIYCDICEDWMESPREVDDITYYAARASGQCKDLEDVCHECATRLDDWYFDLADNGVEIEPGVLEYQGDRYEYETHDGEIIPETLKKI